MHKLTRHVVLIGFKHVGKTAIGKTLAEKLSVPFIDLDQQIENSYEQHFQHKLSCRQIMQDKGESFFRELEKETLTAILNQQPSILSVGGGTPMQMENQNYLKSCTIVHVTAAKGIVYERIQMSGLPAFFNPDEDLLNSFNLLWNKRMTVYKKISHLTIKNNKSVDEAALNIMHELAMNEIKSNDNK